LRKIFKANPKPLIGLDMGASSLKWVELAQDGNSTLILERCVMEPLEAGWIVAGRIEQFDEVAAALRRLVKASDSSSRQVALAMPDSAVIMTKIRLPSEMGEVELVQQVELEVERLSGQPLAEMSIDYSVQGPAPAPGASGEVGVLIAASTKVMVQDRLGLAEAAGLEPVVVDVEGEASMQAAHRLIGTLCAASASPVVALIQVGAEGCSLQVTHQGEVIHATRKFGDDVRWNEPSLQAVSQPFITRLADDLARELDGFVSASSFRKIDTVLLAGGSVVLPSLQVELKQRTFFECVLVNPFSGMRLSEAIQSRPIPDEVRASMLTACGLALRRFNGSC
jgi:type IV pilus assembly protein PilM